MWLNLFQSELLHLKRYYSSLICSIVVNSWFIIFPCVNFSIALCFSPVLHAHIRSSAGIVNYYSPFLEVMYNFICFVFFLTTGGLVLEHYKGNLKPLQGSDLDIALGAICVINWIIYLIDGSLAIKQRIE